MSSASWYQLLAKMIKEQNTAQGMRGALALSITNVPMFQLQRLRWLMKVRILNLFPDIFQV